MTCGLIAGLAGCDDTRSEPHDSAGSVLDLSQALQSAVASCAESARTCQAEADAGAASDASCHASFVTCREAATESAKPALESAVKACAETAKTCRDAATTDDAKDACKEQLSTCIGEQKPDAGHEGDKGDAGDKPEKPDAGSSSPVAPCIEALHTCIDGDEPARTCTSALQECIAMSVGHQGTPPEHDAGKPERDAGKPDLGDASKPEHDAAKPDLGDAGKPERDAALGGKPDEAPHPDAAMPSTPADAGASDSSKECKDAREACLANGEDKEACARMLRACRDR